MILAIGEALVEFRRLTADGQLTVPGEWAGPFPSGAPAIFASVAVELDRVALRELWPRSAARGACAIAARSVSVLGAMQLPLERADLGTG